MRFAVLAGFAVLAMVAAGCRAALAPGLVHRFDTGSYYRNPYDPERRKPVTGALFAEVGGYVPYKNPDIGGGGVFLSVGMEGARSPDSHSRFEWLIAIADLRYRHVFSETEATPLFGARRRYFALGLGAGGGGNSGLGSTYAELGIEFVFGKTSFDLSLRHRYILVHEPDSKRYIHLNLFQVGFAFGAAH